MSISKLNQYLNSQNIFEWEGGSEADFSNVLLQHLVKQLDAPLIMEIGFNAGHSADLFLSSNPKSSLISFDLGYHHYIPIAKRYIDENYPNRHHLILGDSTISVPQFINTNDLKFDIIYVDGGHDYLIAKSDIFNSKKLAHKDTIIIFDDCVFDTKEQKEWNIGPTKVWLELLESNLVVQLGRIFVSSGRGMVWGKYVM